MKANNPYGAAKLTTADGRPLKAALARDQQRARRRALLLTLPLLLFVLITFVAPIAQMLYRSVHNPAFADNMPHLGAWLRRTAEGTEPDEAAFAALVADLALARSAKSIGTVATRINYDYPGSRSLFTSSARRAARLEAPYRKAVLAMNEKWGDPRLWAAMRGAASPYTLGFYLAALDHTRDAEGNIVPVNEERRIYTLLFQRTLILSLVITTLCLLLAYPLAHLLASSPPRRANVLMIFVLLPFWTSLLVRTTSWIALLQQQGVINDALVAAGVLADGNRLQMVYNQAGTIIAMTHILLPFAVLPLYSVMRAIPPAYVQAARSLGAGPWIAFRKVYLPQTMPGVGAGALLVFILAVGYYVTPALVGGASGQLISNLIAFHMTTSLNWSLAAALGALLLAGVLALYWLYDRLVGIENMSFH